MQKHVSALAVVFYVLVPMAHQLSLEPPSAEDAATHQHYVGMVAKARAAFRPSRNQEGELEHLTHFYGINYDRASHSYADTVLWVEVFRNRKTQAVDSAIAVFPYRAEREMPFAYGHLKAVLKDMVGPVLSPQDKELPYHFKNITFYKATNGRQEPLLRIQNQFNDRKQPTESLWEKFEGKSWHPWRKDLHTIDPQGRMTETKHLVWDKEWVLVSGTRIVVTEVRGKPSKTEVVVWDASAKNYVRKLRDDKSALSIEYRYGTHGKVQTCLETWKNPKTGEEAQRDSIAVTWLSFNALALDMFSPIPVGGGNYRTLTRYTYNKQENSWAPPSRTTRHLTARGDLKSIKTERLLEGAWKPVTETVYEYDPKGNQTSMTERVQWGNRRDVLSSRRTAYTFNELGYRTEVVVRENIKGKESAHHKSVFVYKGGGH